MQQFRIFTDWCAVQLVKSGVIEYPWNISIEPKIIIMHAQRQQNIAQWQASAYMYLKEDHLILSCIHVHASHPEQPVIAKKFTCRNFSWIALHSSSAAHFEKRSYWYFYIQGVFLVVQCCLSNTAVSLFTGALFMRKVTMSCKFLKRTILPHNESLLTASCPILI